jgi:23S rRNA (adenine-N6)-dimethyltransferase
VTRARLPWTRIGFVGLIGTSLALGGWGFALDTADVPDRTWFDVLYYDLQLFVLGADPASDGGALSWQLQIARFLAPAARRVLAHELDPRLAARLADRYRDPALGVRVVHGDFTRARPPREPFAVVGNIPYSRTADIVRWCLDAPELTSATLVTQLEYARKRTGAHGRWSRLTVLTWPWWSWRLAGRIGRDRFRPQPRVDAGVLVLRRRTGALVPWERRGEYRRMVELGFGGVGGSLSASLRRVYPAARVATALRKAGVAAGAPVGLVSPDQWVVVFRVLAG